MTDPDNPQPEPPPPAITSFRGPHAFLSNFYPHPVTYDGVTYPTAEHAFAAAKTLDLQQRARIAATPRPAEAKRIGRTVTLRDNWDGIKLQIAAQIIATKFTDPHLAQLLVATGTAELIEGNTWGDTYWGVCRGRGANHLGRLLMQQRDTITSRHPDASQELTDPT